MIWRNILFAGNLRNFLVFFFQFCFVARKKYNQVSLLHVVHHGIMPLSVWPGARFFPGGHSSFFGLLNVLVHFFMYGYYMLAAMGPKVSWNQFFFIFSLFFIDTQIICNFGHSLQYQKYLWWKQHLTTLQMIQFVLIMVHGFQLVFYDDCDFPWQFAYYIGAHAILFFILFSEFYVKNYLTKKKSKKVRRWTVIVNYLIWVLTEFLL